jgi:hypothetical protein
MAGRFCVAGTANIEGRHRGSRDAAARTILKPGGCRLGLVSMALALASGVAWAGPSGSAADARLLLRFAEDGAVVRQAWTEAGFSWDRFAGGKDARFIANVAFRYGRDVEAGMVVPVLHRSRSADDLLFGSEVDEGFSTTGFGDLVLYGKYRVVRSPFDLTVGATCVLPLADGDSGLTSGALQGSGFVGLRKRFSAVTLAGHAGFTVSEDARYGEKAEGLVAATLGFGALVPIAPMWVLVTELDYAGAEFEADGVSSRALLGLDWRPMSTLVVRGGVGAGLSDAAPDVFAIASVAFDL